MLLMKLSLFWSEAEFMSKPQQVLKNKMLSCKSRWQQRQS